MARTFEKIEQTERDDAGAARALAWLPAGARSAGPHSANAMTVKDLRI